MVTTKKIEILQSDYRDPQPEVLVSYPVTLNLVRLGFATFGRLFPQSAGKMAYRLFSTPRTRARHKQSDPVLESARLFEFLYAGQILKGYEWGRGDRIVLLVHGWESRGTALRSFVPDLIGQGYRVVAFDGPAHGNSPGKSTNLFHFGGAVKAIITQLDGVEAIITHSFGGPSTVFALGTMAPEIRIRKLVLIASPNRLELVLSGACQTLNLPTGARRHFFRLIEKQIGMPVADADVSRIGERIKVEEALLVYDENDPVVSTENAREIFAAWEHSSLLLTRDYGHFRLMKNPDLIRKVTEFIIT